MKMKYSSRHCRGGKCKTVIIFLLYCKLIFLYKHHGHCGSLLEGLKHLIGNWKQSTRNYEQTYCQPYHVLWNAPIPIIDKLLKYRQSSLTWNAAPAGDRRAGGTTAQKADQPSQVATASTDQPNQAATKIEINLAEAVAISLWLSVPDLVDCRESSIADRYTSDGASYLEQVRATELRC